MMIMHSIPLSIGGLGILLLGGLLAVGAVYSIRRILHTGLRRRPPDFRGSGDCENPALTEAAIYRLAKKQRGRLTVSDVVIAAGTSPSDAERVLDGMADGIRVTIEVTENGSVVYEFGELTEASVPPESMKREYPTG